MDPLFSLAAPEVRRLLEQLLPTDGDFDAFVLDYFPEVKRRFSGGMERVVKTNLLFESIDRLVLCAKLREAFPRVYKHVLVVVNGSEAGRKYPLPPRGELVIGRAPDCDIVVADKLISRRQAVVEVTSYVVFLKQEGRTPLYRNGDRIESKGVLFGGDIIRFGNTTLRFDSPLAAAASSPVSSEEPTPMQDDQEEEELLASTTRADQHRLFWSLSDKLLTMGRMLEAELTVGPRLRETLQRVEAGEVLELRIVRDVLHRALKLATLSKKAEWFGFVFDFARACKHVMDIHFLDEVYTQLFTLRPAIEPQVRAYAQAITAPKLQPQLNTIRKLYTQ